MNTKKKWDDASQKDLIFAVLMSTGDGSGNIKADWQKVEKIMISWGYSFTLGAMSQHWSKTIQKAFKERHPDNAKDGGSTNPTTPSKANAGSRTPKTPASSNGKGKNMKRTAPDDDDEGDESGGAFNSKPIAKGKTPRAAAKKMKYSEDSDEYDPEENFVVKGETVDKDYDHAI